ncbi:MAG: hypothetical protein ABI977_12590 [Acidobacteriota bacterium]
MKLTTCIAAGMLLMAAITVNADQKLKRIQFERGRTSAVVKGIVTNSEQENVHEYKLRVGKGQKIIAHLASPEKSANFMLSLPGGSTADDGQGKAELKDWEGTIPASGDVVIAIYHRGKKHSMSYTLEVSVR